MDQSRLQMGNDQVEPKEVYKCIWYPHDDYLVSGWNDNIYQIHYNFDEPFCARQIWSDILVPIENTNRTFNRVMLFDTNIHNKLVAICNQNGDVGLLSKQEGFYKLETSGAMDHSRILKFNPSGTFLILANYLGEICIWDVESRKLKTYHETCTLIMDMDWQTDYVFAVTNGYEIDMHEYNLTDYTTKCISQLKGHTDVVNGIQWDETRTYLASRSDDQTVKIWGTNFTTYIENLQHHTDFISDIKWCKNSSPTKLVIASASYDGTIFIWKSHNRESPICISIGRPIEIFNFNITGRYLAVGCEDKMVVLETNTFSKLFEYYNEDGIFSFAWNKSGKKLAACIPIIGINVYDIETKNVLCIEQKKFLADLIL